MRRPAAARSIAVGALAAAADADKDLIVQHSPHLRGVDSELTCPGLVAHQMSAAPAFVLMWAWGRGVSVVPMSTGLAAERI